MEGGARCLPGCAVGLSPLRSADEVGGLSWPPFTQLKDQNPPQLSLLYPSQQATSLLWLYPSRRCCAPPRLPDWCPWDRCPPHTGTLVLLCPCQCGSRWYEAHPEAPSFCNEKVVPNSPITESGKTCVAPLLAPEGLSGGVSNQGVMIISIPSPKSPQSKFCASESSGLRFLWELRSVLLHRPPQRKGFCKEVGFSAGASPVNLAVTICLLPCDLTLKPALNMPSRHRLLRWEAGYSPLLTRHLGPSAASAPRGAQARSAKVSS